MAAERRASSLPPANPFWSDRTQADHELEQMRPVNLESWEAPVPHDDDDLDQSPRVPLPSGVSGHDREHGLQFQTPGDAKPAALTLDSEKPCVEEPEKLETEVTYEPLQHDQATGKRPERVWNRRGQCDEKMSSKAVPSCDENEKKESGLEKDLGDQVLQHFQQETVRLQSQNDSLIKEIQRLKEEKQRSELNVPSSWNASARQPTPPPRKSPQTRESQHVWMSPDTFRCTPNGTRIPSGPPPPSPPPLPAWPVDLQGYETCLEPPRKLRGVMGDVQYKIGGGVITPREARTMWLEREVESLKERLEREAIKNKSTFNLRVLECSFCD